MDDTYHRMIFGGIHRQRTREEALDLKDFIENKTILNPVYWMTFTFKHTHRVEDAEKKIGQYFNRVCHAHIQGHIQPIIVWNTIDGKVKNDNHVILLNDKTKYDLTSPEKIMSIRRQWKHGILPEVKVYDKDEFAVLYATLKHREQGFMIFCQGNGSCYDKNRRKNCCKYRKYPHKLLK